MSALKDFEVNGTVTFFDTSMETKAMIRVGAVIEDEFFLFSDQDGELRSSELPYHCRLGRLNKGSWTILDIGFD